MDCIVRGVIKSRTQLSDFHFHWHSLHSVTDCNVLNTHLVRGNVLSICDSVRINVSSQYCAMLCHSVMSSSLPPHGWYPTRLLCPWDSPGKNSGVGCHAFSRGSSQPRDWTQISTLQGILYHLSHQGSLWILQWVAYPFFRRSSQPRNQIRVSCISGGFFTSWATREAHSQY